MNRSRCFLFFLLLIPAVHSIAIPINISFPGWQVENQKTFSPETLCEYIDGAAELLLEFGFKEMRIARLSRGKTQLSVEIYQMEEPLSALGIYLAKCAPETPLAGIIPRNSGDSWQLEIVKGSQFIVINRFDKNRESLPLMQKLANKLAAEIPDVTAKWPCTLPEKGLIKSSIRLARGPLALHPVFPFGKADILQLHRKIWAIIADYRVQKGIKTLIRINYPDEKKSRAVFFSLLENLDSQLKIIRKNDTTFIFQHNENTWVTIHWHHKILDIIKFTVSCRQNWNSTQNPKTKSNKEEI